MYDFLVPKISIEIERDEHYKYPMLILRAPGSSAFRAWAKDVGLWCPNEKTWEFADAPGVRERLLSKVKEVFGVEVTIEERQGSTSG